MKLSLFDKLVSPIVLYCSEIWSIYNHKEVDKLHIIDKAMNVRKTIIDLPN